jgi:hypothetical protein
MAAILKYTEMGSTLKYTLKDFNEIMFNGFNLDLPLSTIEIISKLAQEVGSPDYVKTPVFKKRDNNDLPFKKKRGTETAKSFQTTRLEEKVGTDAQIDMIRSNLNKMTDKNYIDIRNKIFDTIDGIMTETDDINRVSTVIFEIASNNRFFSKMYAELYADLINKYDVMKGVFENSLTQFTQLFDTIEYVESTVDYDKFCKINKDNERRKALSAFFTNLMDNNIISKERIVEITRNLLFQMYTFISMENKKNEVDELTENIALLYRPDLYATITYEPIDGMNITQLIDMIAHSKTKDYKSLTNKALFKFMDLLNL